MPVARRRSLFAALLAVAVVLGLASAPSAGAAADGAQRRAGPPVTVASYNLYLGADLNPLFAATSIPDLVARAGGVYAAMERTDYRERSRAIARLIARERPDVVGLQEVALWQTAPLTSSTWTTTYDFLQITLDALAARGAHYRVAAVNTNFTNADLPFPIPISATTKAQFTDRDVILVGPATGGAAGACHESDQPQLRHDAAAADPRTDDPGPARLLQRRRRRARHAAALRQHPPRGLRRSRRTHQDRTGHRARRVPLDVTAAVGRRR
jgi:hypothetical protein